MYQANERHYIVTIALREGPYPFNMLYSWEAAKGQTASSNRHNVIEYSQYSSELSLLFLSSLTMKLESASHSRGPAFKL
jgi:hypothetical protein